MREGRRHRRRATFSLGYLLGAALVVLLFILLVLAVVD